MEFTGVGAHEKKRLGEETENEGSRKKKKGTVFRALHVSSHLIFGKFSEVGTINISIFSVEKTETRRGGYIIQGHIAVEVSGSVRFPPKTLAMVVTSFLPCLTSPQSQPS